MGIGEYAGTCYVTDLPFEHRFDATNRLVDLGPAEVAVNHVLADRLQLERTEIVGHELAVEFMDCFAAVTGSTSRHIPNI